MKNMHFSVHPGFQI